MGIKFTRRTQLLGRWCLNTDQGCRVFNEWDEMGWVNVNRRGIKFKNQGDWVIGIFTKAEHNFFA